MKYLLIIASLIAFCTLTACGKKGDVNPPKPSQSNSIDNISG